MKTKRFNPWILSPIIGISATALANTALLVTMQTSGANTDSVVQHAFKHSSSFDERRHARMRFNNQGYKLQITTLNQQATIKLNTPTEQRPETLALYCYRASASALDEQLVWINTSEPFVFSPKQQGLWTITVSGESADGSIQTSQQVYID